MSNEDRVHIIKRDDGWVLKRDGAKRAYRWFNTKEEAIDLAKNYRSRGYDVVVHRTDGTVERWIKSDE